MPIQRLRSLATTEFCDGSSSTLDAGAGYDMYMWSDGSMMQTLDVTTSGTYSVTVTDNNGCRGTDDMSITVNANPTPMIWATRLSVQGIAPPWMPAPTMCICGRTAR